MTSSGRYLRQDVMAEPLFNQWYAIYPCIPPATAAMYLTNSHLKALKSFVDGPKIHADALRNPAFAGSPFVAIDPARVDEVRALLQRTREDCAELVRFAQAAKETNALLDGCTGLSLEPLYAQLPEALRGYVELVYDLRHSPSARYIEGALYRSPYYREASQSVALSLTQGDQRPFVMSTPRLDEPWRLRIDQPFRSDAYDALFAAKRHPADVDALAERLGVPAGAQRALFETFFTDAPPPPSPKFEGPGVRVRFFGHACVLVESAACSVLIDPLISYPSADPPARFCYADLPERIDYVLITHIHADHVVLEALLQLRSRIGTVLVPRASGDGFLDPSLKWMFRMLGFPRVEELDEFDTLEVPGGSITGVPFFGEHCDLAVRTKIAHFLRLEGKSLLAATDGNALEPRIYELAQAQLGPLDVLMLGTESEGAAISYGYGNLFTRPVPRQIDQGRRQNGSNARSALEIVRRLRPGQVQNYAMGLEPWLKHLFPVHYTETSPQIRESNAFLEGCRALGVPAARPFGKAELTL